MQWASSRRLEAVEILALSHGPDLARRVGLLAAGRPAVDVWTIDGATLRPAEPIPVGEPPSLAAEVWALAGVISEAGGRPVDDHGRLVAEVAGLEVARVVAGDDGPAIDVGVGLADRELNRVVHRDLDPGAGLRRVIVAVAEHRNPRSHHPLTRLARARWLRSVLLDDPALIGATELRPLPPLRAGDGVADEEPSAAAGRLRSGRPAVAVTVAGVDLDLVPEAADYRERWDPEAQLVLVMAGRDAKLNTALLPRVHDASTVVIDPPWSSR